MKRHLIAALAAACLTLAASAAALAQTTRGPYLNNSSATAITVRWRTSAATNSRVRHGTVQGSLTSFVDNTAVTTEHEVRVTGLSANTRYYHSVGSTTTQQAGNDANHFFVTAPATGTNKATRIWVLGDAGTGSSSQTAVRDAYYTGLSMNIRRDDGAVIYINGTEVARSSMPTGTITYTTAANGTSSETTFFAHTAPASVLVNGTNVIAVEIHQSGPTSSDISFNMDLIGNR